MSLFTKIIKREIPSEIVYEQDNLIVIKNIKPEAKTHLLIIPKKEIATINDLEENDKDLLCDMFMVAKKLALQLEISQGYTLHFNVGELGGQEIMHIHLHLLSNIK